MSVQYDGVPSSEELRRKDSHFRQAIAQTLSAQSAYSGWYKTPPETDIDRTSSVHNVLSGSVLFWDISDKPQQLVYPAGLSLVRSPLRIAIHSSQPI